MRSSRRGPAPLPPRVLVVKDDGTIDQPFENVSELSAGGELADFSAPQLSFGELRTRSCYGRRLEG